MWEIKAIIQGYNNRMMMLHRTQWESTRWQTCYILQALGCKSIHQPSDLIGFNWEKEATDPQLSDEQVEELRKKIDIENSRIPD